MNSLITESSPKKTRIDRVVWVDSLKLFACLLVVFGHLYMSMASSGLMDGDSAVYLLPIQTVYTFHVPVFFVCSGFLYQYNKGGSSFSSHLMSLKRKIINLGVPYIVFSSATLLLKNVFASEVNNQATPFLRTILFEPIAPYWYLYTLLLIFCIIPRLGRPRAILKLLAVSLAIKVVYVLLPEIIVLPDLIGKVASNLVWFSLGMSLTVAGFRKLMMHRTMAIVLFIAAAAASLVLYGKENTDKITQFLIGFAFVYSLVDLFMSIDVTNESRLLRQMSAYFLPVYVLHTICAACMRSILFKFGLDSLAIHLTVGFIASVFIPVVIYEIAERRWWLLILFEPTRALKMKKGECNERV